MLIRECRAPLQLGPVFARRVDLLMRRQL